MLPRDTEILRGRAYSGNPARAFLLRLFGLELYCHRDNFNSQKMNESIKKVPDANSVGERLRWLRDFKGLTLKQFSARVNCDPGYLSKLESGKAVNPSPRFLVHVSMAFYINADWLISGSGQPFGSSKEPQNQLGKDGYNDSSMRVFSVLDELPSALAGEKVLAVLLKDCSLHELQAIWSEVRLLPDLPTTAVHFWNEVFMRAQFQKMKFSQQEISLTKEAESLTSGGVQPVLPKLIQRLKRATEARGSKSKLAAWLGVHRQCVTDWLSGKQEPGGEITLRLLKWVEQQERQK